MDSGVFAPGDSTIPYFSTSEKEEQYHRLFSTIDIFSLGWKGLYTKPPEITGGFVYIGG